MDSKDYVFVASCRALRGQHEDGGNWWLGSEISVILGRWWRRASGEATPSGLGLARRLGSAVRRQSPDESLRAALGAPRPRCRGHLILRVGIGAGVLVAIASFGPPLTAQGLLPNAAQTFTGVGGEALAGGFVYTYVPGTTTPKTTYVDQGLTVPNTNPIRLNANGQGTIWGPTGLYRQVVTDAQGNVIWDQITNQGVAGAINLQGLLYVSAFGADITGATDATAGISACLAAAGPGGTCFADRGAKLRILENLSIPAQTTFDCGLSAMTDLNPPLVTSSLGPTLRLSPGKSILMAGTSARVQNCLVIPDGMSFPQTSAGGWTGTAINTQSITNPQVINTTIVGFDTAINATGSQRAQIEHVYADGSGVTNGGVILAGNGGDLAQVTNLKIQVLGTATTCPARIRPGTGLKVTGSAWLDNVIAQDFQVTDFNISDVGSILAGRLWADYDSADGCARGTSTGMIISNAQDVHIGHLDLNGMQTGAVVSNQGAQQSTHIDDVFLNLIGQDGIVIGAASGTGTQQSAGLVQVDMIRTNQGLNNVGRYAVNYIDASNYSFFKLGGGNLWSINDSGGGGTAPYIHIPATVLAAKIDIAEKVVSDLTNWSYLWGPPTLQSSTGLGSGSASLLGSLLVSPWSGVIHLAPTGSPAASGNVVLLWPALSNSFNCTAGVAKGTAFWVGGTVQASDTAANTTQFDWTSTGALTAGQTYDIHYICKPQ